ncbi:cytochrome c oxidase assembly protein [Frankia sp. AiPs1]|uniref:cytochrome c oxidase assembly protein n=1 Tax=Frankia sp. AiPs1 TaxID=573493 RepID=UPI002043076D|nr:cytochrome c oxidase assembly protein [Frankia sp. AiPs1]MCM3923401.1 cytochrome c oxidase assembly protein [Frankia sp. AiPs1]
MGSGQVFTSLQGAGVPGPPSPRVTAALSSPSHPWATFHVDPVACALIGIAAAGYAYGLRRRAGRGESWPVRRTVVFFGPGLLSLLVFTMAWPGAYAHALFSAYIVQVLGLFMITPVLLTCGRPVELVRSVASDRLRGIGGRVSRVRLLRGAVSPIFGALLVPVITSVVVFTGIFGASLRSEPIYHTLQIALLALGFLVAVPLIEESAQVTGIAAAAALFISFLELLLDSIPGGVLTFRTHLLAPVGYLALHRSWGPAPLTDQHTAGAILWAVGEVADLPFVAVLMVRWMRVDEREAREADRLLDEAEGGATLMRPWWETDPRPPR